MKDQSDEKLFTKKELLLCALFFSIYTVTLLSLDPEWVMWLGFTTLGTTPPPDLPPPLFSDPHEALQAASLLSLVGLLALLLLMLITGEVNFGWLSWLKAQLRERWSQGGREAREGSEVGAGASPLDVDVRREEW